MTKNIILGFSISMVGCLVADWLFHTSQLPEGLISYWVAGGVWAAIVLQRGAGWVAYLVSLAQAMRAPSGAARLRSPKAKSYASEDEFNGEG